MSNTTSSPDGLFLHLQGEQGIDISNPNTGHSTNIIFNSYPPFNDQPTATSSGTTSVEFTRMMQEYAKHQNEKEMNLLFGNTTTKNNFSLTPQEQLTWMQQSDGSMGWVKAEEAALWKIELDKQKQMESKRLQEAKEAFEFEKFSRIKKWKEDAVTDPTLDEIEHTIHDMVGQVTPEDIEDAQKKDIFDCLSPGYTDSNVHCS